MRWGIQPKIETKLKLTCLCTLLGIIDQFYYSSYFYLFKDERVYIIFRRGTKIHFSCEGTYVTPLDSSWGLVISCGLKGVVLLVPFYTPPCHPTENS